MKRTGMTNLPGLSSQSVSRFSGRKGPTKPETDWDDKPGKPESERESDSESERLEVRGERVRVRVRR